MNKLRTTPLQIEISRREFDRHFVVWQREFTPRLLEAAYYHRDQTGGYALYSDYWFIIGVFPARRDAQNCAVSAQVANQKGE